MTNLDELFPLDGRCTCGKVKYQLLNKPLFVPTSSTGGQKIVRCDSCKIALWSHYSGAGDVISLVRIGTLEDPNVLPPDIHIYTSTQQHWLKFSDDIPRVEEYYQKKDYWPAESIERFDELMGK